jgi:hypothetical protein
MIPRAPGGQSAQVVDEQHSADAPSAGRDGAAAKVPLVDEGQGLLGGNGLGGEIFIALECAGDETLLATDRGLDEIGLALVSPTDA